MSDLIEIAITSDANGSMWSSCAWDPRTGTHLMTYKGKTLALTNQVVLSSAFIRVYLTFCFLRRRRPDSCTWTGLHQESVHRHGEQYETVAAHLAAE